MSDFTPPAFPEPGEALAPANPSSDTLTLLARRRSTVAKNMTGPGPDAGQLETLLKIAARTPDHGKLFPWRFIVFEGEARARFGEVLETRLRELEPDGPDERYALERNRFLRAPVVIAVISDVTENHKIPEWEQVLSAGAVCQNLLIGASALGFAAQWLTEWYAYDRVVKTALGLAPGERVAGFIYVGSATADADERPRKAPQVSRWG
ncbi:MAG: nitroreductase [Alphaproteobacteria bacterium]|nr:nitroreductase [Alphaproteobacteria bacterium]